jgi:hypothetical protein
MLFPREGIKVIDASSVNAVIGDNPDTKILEARSKNSGNIGSSNGKSNVASCSHAKYMGISAAKL